MSVGDGRLEVSHIQYADDLIIFSEASSLQVKNIKGILRCFEALSGLGLNIKKTRVFGINIDESSINQWAKEIGSSIDAFPSVYRVALRGWSKLACVVEAGG